MQVVNEVRDFLTKHSIESSSILVAFSGGTDSTVLLAALMELKEEFDLDLTLAHLDHCIRGESSKADAKFVREKADELGLEVIVDRRQVKRIADKESRSLEEAARQARYRFLAEAADERGFDYVALGHNKNDQAETVLMNIIRGSGLRGLGGMAEVTGRYIRPLLGVSREEIQRYIRENGLQYRRDETNKDTEYLRNRIRHELIPRLEDNYNPKVVNNVTRLAKLATEAQSFVENRADSLAEQIRVTGDVDGPCLDREELGKYDTYLQKVTVRKFIEQAKGDLQDVTSTHVNEVIAKISEEPSRARLSLPGVTFTLTREMACFVRNYTSRDEVKFRYRLTPGDTLTVKEAGTSISLEIVGNLEKIDPKEFSSDSLTEFVDWGKVEQPIVVRNRNAGDKFIPLGMDEEKKVKDFLIDEKVPYKRRDKIPFLCDRRGIIWIVGYRIDDRYKLEPSTSKGLLMKAEKI